MQKTTIKLTFNHDNPLHMEALNFVKKIKESHKEKKIQKLISDEEIIMTLLTKPSKKSYEEIKNKVVNSLSDKDKFNALYESYKSTNNLEITETEFTMNHLRNIGKREETQLIREYLN